eukprot:643168-Rhodomonas_salina.1
MPSLCVAEDPPAGAGMVRCKASSSGLKCRTLSIAFRIVALASSSRPCARNHRGDSKIKARSSTGYRLASAWRQTTRVSSNHRIMC